MIALFMPLIRKEQGKQVLLDLNEQVIKPDLLYIVDNSGDFEFDPFEFDYSIIHGKRTSNTGVNPCWNLMWGEQFSNYKYVGIIGDDYRLNKYNLIRMYQFLETTSLKAVTCLIKKARELPLDPSGLGMKYVPCEAKGRLGFSLFNREFLVEKIPPIPDQFNVYFGDNWIGHHLHKAGEELYQLSDTMITHHHWEDIATPLGLKEKILEERVAWKVYIRGELNHESNCSQEVQRN